MFTSVAMAVTTLARLSFWPTTWLYALSSSRMLQVSFCAGTPANRNVACGVLTRTWTSLLMPKLALALNACDESYVGVA